MAVYFITAPSGHVKIGFTDQSVEVRLASLQTGCWENLTIAVVLEGGLEDESAYQHEFRKDHIRGDWFNLSAKIREFLDQFESYEGRQSWRQQRKALIRRCEADRARGLPHADEVTLTWAQMRDR